MSNITTNITKQIVLRNCIQVDSKAVKYQEYTINSESPENMQLSDYFADEEAKQFYKENRVAIRTEEAAFEDEAYLVQDAMIAEKETQTQSK